MERKREKSGWRIEEFWDDDRERRENEGGFVKEKEEETIAALAVRVLPIISVVVEGEEARWLLSGFAVLTESDGSGPQITSSIGKSFVQLLTNRAVLIALGPTGDGGDIGCI